jgi:hypothetical protein
MKDENRFRELMTVLGEIHDRKITRLLLDVYWRVLEPFPDEACIRAFHELIRMAKFFPKPAEFLEHLEARREDRAAAAWLNVVVTLKRFGNYQSVRFPDPVIHSVIEAMGGWVRFGLMEEKERPWKQKEFERFYSILAARGGSHPPYLAGICEIENAANGYRVPAVIDVGVCGGINRLVGSPVDAAADDDGDGGDDGHHRRENAARGCERQSLIHISASGGDEVWRIQ